MDTAFIATEALVVASADVALVVEPATANGGMEGEMRKLTPKQARWVEERAYDLRKAGTHGVVASFQEALDEVTAKPGDEEFCEGCMWWARCYDQNGCEQWFCSWVGQLEQADPDVGFFIWSLPPPRECPIGRWDEVSRE